MKSLAAFRAFGAAFALVLLGFAAHATLPLPAVQGPYLGDQNTNLTTIVNAINQDNQIAFTPSISASQTTTQAGCTVLVNPMNNVATSASTGSVCLPTATAGREMFIGNGTTQTIDIFSNATPFTSGTQDTINGTAGTTAYAGLTSGKNTQCFSPQNGIWYCNSGN